MAFKKYLFATVVIMSAGIAAMKLTTNDSHDFIAKLPPEMQEKAKSVNSKNTVGEMTSNMIRESTGRK